MTIAFYTDCLSPHQLPLAAELANTVGEKNFRYIFYTNHFSEERIRLGWGDGQEYSWCQYLYENETLSLKWLHEADILISGSRSSQLLSIYEKRDRDSLVTFYQSERWFKPPTYMLRLLHPGYLRMAIRMARLIVRGRNFVYLPYGIHAATDMARLCGLVERGLLGLRTPSLRFISKWNPGDRCFDEKTFAKILMWGYFVRRSGNKIVDLRGQGDNLKVLWVGRMLRLKHVDDIIRAVGYLRKEKGMRIQLDLYGAGVELERLRSLASKFDNVQFHSPVLMSEVRRIMRKCDVYVLASNGIEGWGAVANEALEEEMTLVGTNQAGASATLLPKERRYSCGDWRELAKILYSMRTRDSMKMRTCDGIGNWTPSYAAAILLSRYRELEKE